MAVDLNSAAGAVLQYSEVATRGKFATWSTEQKIEYQSSLRRDLIALNTTIEEVRSGHTKNATARIDAVLALHNVAINGNAASAGATESSRSRQANLAVSLEFTPTMAALMHRQGHYLPGYRSGIKDADGNEGVTVSGLLEDSLAAITTEGGSQRQPSAALGEDFIKLSQNAIGVALQQNRTPDQQELALWQIKQDLDKGISQALGQSDPDLLNAAMQDAYVELGLDNVTNNCSQESDNAETRYLNIESALNSGKLSGGMDQSWMDSLSDLKTSIGIENLGKAGSLAEDARGIPTSLDSQKKQMLFQLEQSEADSEIYPYAVRMLEIPGVMAVRIALGYKANIAGTIATMNYLGENPGQTTKILSLYKQMGDQVDAAGEPTTLATSELEKRMMVRLYIENQTDAGPVEGMGHQWWRTRFGFKGKTGRVLKAAGKSDVEIGQMRRSMQRFVENGGKGFTLEPTTPEEAFASFQEGLPENASQAEISAAGISFMESHPNLGPDITRELIRKHVPYLMEAKRLEVEGERVRALDAFEKGRGNTTDLLDQEPPMDWQATPDQLGEDMASTQASDLEYKHITPEMKAQSFQDLFPPPALPKGPAVQKSLHEKLGAKVLGQKAETTEGLDAEKVALLGGATDYGEAPLAADVTKKKPAVAPVTPRTKGVTPPASTKRTVLHEAGGKTLTLEVDDATGEWTMGGEVLDKRQSEALAKMHPKGGAE